MLLLWGNYLKARYQIYEDVSGKYRFRLRASNNKIVAISEAYESKASCKQGIEAVKKSCEAAIEDLTTNSTAQKIPEQCTGNAITGITMISPPDIVQSGSIVTFEGFLINEKTGEGLQKAKVIILEHDRSLLADKVLASGETGKGGSFNINGKSYQADFWDDSVEVYAKFVGKENCRPSRSAYYKIRVV